jgi:LETM1 and EF-hand domain-containing protein 1
LFDDDLTLDNPPHLQLVMYRYMAINAFETDNVVRDDEVIYGEGVDELSTSEL